MSSQRQASLKTTPSAVSRVPVVSTPARAVSAASFMNCVFPLLERQDGLITRSDRKNWAGKWAACVSSDRMAQFMATAKRVTVAARWRLFRRTLLPIDEITRSGASRSSLEQVIVIRPFSVVRFTLCDKQTHPSDRDVSLPISPPRELRMRRFNSKLCRLTVYLLSSE